MAHEEHPFYVYGQNETPNIRMLGQGIGDSSIYSLGVGARKYWGVFFVFGEVGYGVIDQGANRTIQQEIVYTELVLRHNVEFRPIPVYPQGNYDQDSYETVWELDDGLLGAIGIGYQLGDHVSLTGAYRPFYVKEHIELYDAEKRKNGGGWWQETRSLDLSAFEFRVEYKF